MKRALNEIKKHHVFEELFPINEAIRDRIKQDMSDNGFDENQPVALAIWPGQSEGVLIDGYTRYSVAAELGIDEIPMVRYQVESEREAFQIALKRQTHRRSLTDPEIMNCIEAILSRYGGPPNGGLPFTVREIADSLGITKRKAERALRVAEHATEESKEEIRQGKTSIHRAEQAIKASCAKPSKRAPKKRLRAARVVEIDPDQWEHLEELSELTHAEIEEIVYEALELYFRNGDDTETEEDGDLAECETFKATDDGEEESDVDAA